MIPLFFPLLSLIAGIVASAYLDPRPVWICLPLAISLAIARRPCALLAIFLGGSGLRSLERPVPSLPSGSEASRVVGTLVRRPDWRGLGVYLDLRVNTVDGVPYAGRARFTEFIDSPEVESLFHSLDLGAGDRLEVVVRLRRPVTYRDPGVFDFRQYLERQGVFWTGTIRNPRLITVVQRSSWMRHGADRLQEIIEQRISRPFIADKPAQGLVLGMTLGRKQDLVFDVERDFQAGGLYHMVVVSGFNLAVIAGAVTFLSRLFVRRRNIRFLIVVIATLAYAALVGVQPPVIRAAVMVCILITGRLLDRRYSALNAIALAAMLLLILDPRGLEDSSFQMTFAAAAAIAGIGMPCARWMLHDLHEKLGNFDNVELDGYLSPEVADWRVSRRMFCERHGLPHWVVTGPWRCCAATADALIMSLAVEMVFVVFMVTSFHRLSPVSPFLNLPAGIIAAAVTSLGLSLILSPPLLSGIIGWIIQTLVHLLLALLRVALSVPYASLRVPSPPLYLWVVYGLAVGIVILGVYRRNRYICGLAYAGVVAAQAVIVMGDFSPTPPRNPTITFLDVGQGDSILVEFPSGRRMLIDGGGIAAGRFLGLQDQSTFSIGEDVVSAYLFSRGIRQLDTVVLTHAHNDHMDGLFDILANFRVGELWLGRNPMIPAYRALIELAQRRGIPLRFVTAGEQRGDFTVLHPPSKWRVRKAADNNDSVVLLLRAGKHTVLFTGDMELPLPNVSFADVLKVAHHGSKGVRMRVKSDIRVISVGANNPFGHPHSSALPALRTDVLGAIRIDMDPDRPLVSLP